MTLAVTERPSSNLPSQNNNRALFHRLHPFSQLLPQAYSLSHTSWSSPDSQTVTFYWHENAKRKGNDKNQEGEQVPIVYDHSVAPSPHRFPVPGKLRLLLT